MICEMWRESFFFWCIGRCAFAVFVGSEEEGGVCQRMSS